MIEEEGVIKFRANHREEPLIQKAMGEGWQDLLGWRRVLYELGVVGQDAARYGGAGFGNMSVRLSPGAAQRGSRKFLITGTQTGAVAELTLNQMCVVETYDVKENRVDSFGKVGPSSESLTHGALYDLSPDIRFVFHGHVPVIWNAAQQLGLPTTGADIEYGTQAMAKETERLYHSTTLPESRCYAMAGHEDGVVSFGRTAGEAGSVMVETLARAYALAL